ncbi:MAG: alcohol acetyltransferase [Peptostreptococcaceae bacterium]
MKKTDWYKLDNAAKMYPAILSRKNPATFRVAVLLKEDIDSEILEKSVNEVINRFPTMKVKLKKGIFWNYFQENNKPVKIYKEENTPCFFIDANKNNDYLFRVTYFNKRISVEIFHALTDGTGGIEFLKSILYKYLNLKGFSINCENMIITNNNYASFDEIEDSYHKIYNKDKTNNKKIKNAQHIKGKSLKNNAINVIHGVIDSNELLKISKSFGVTITEYLTALYVLAVFKENKNTKSNPITINIPVNLRNMFDSNSLRNFSFFVNVSIKQENYLDFYMVLFEVKKQLREGIKKENIHSKLNTMISMDKNVFLRVIPLFLKTMILKNTRRLLSDNIKTSTLTNLGVIKLPNEMNEFVNHFEFMLYCSNPVNINVGICTFGDKLVISMSRSIVETNVIRYFFNHLSKDLGLDVLIYSND